MFALASALLAAGHWELDEFRDAIEQLPPADYLAASYYERWLHAVRTLIVAKGLVEPAALADLGGPEAAATAPGPADALTSAELGDG